MISDLLRIIDNNKKDIVDQAIEGFNVMKKIGKIRQNWQSYILTPISTVLVNSGYNIYTNILGVRLPKLPTEVSDEVMNIVWWSESCSPRYKERCLNRATTSEIDAIVVGKEDICLVEHASEIGGLCWDMVKLYKMMISRNTTSACLFLTWYDIKSAEHFRYAETLLRLGKSLFDNRIGQDKWAIVYIPCSIDQKKHLSVYPLEFSHESN